MLLLELLYYFFLYLDLWLIKVELRNVTQRSCCCDRPVAAALQFPKCKARATVTSNGLDSFHHLRALHYPLCQVQASMHCTKELSQSEKIGCFSWEWVLEVILTNSLGHHAHKPAECLRLHKVRRVVGGGEALKTKRGKGEGMKNSGGTKSIWNGSRAEGYTWVTRGEWSKFYLPVFYYRLPHSFFRMTVNTVSITSNPSTRSSAQSGQICSLPSLVAAFPKNLVGKTPVWRRGCVRMDFTMEESLQQRMRLQCKINLLFPLS